MAKRKLKLKRKNKPKRKSHWNKVCDQTTEISPATVTGLATLTDTASILDVVKEAKEKIIKALFTSLTARYTTRDLEVVIILSYLTNNIIQLLYQVG